MSVLYFCQRFSYCPYYWGVQNGKEFASRELTVLTIQNLLDSEYTSPQVIETGVNVTSNSPSSLASEIPTYIQMNSNILGYFPKDPQGPCRLIQWINLHLSIKGEVSQKFDVISKPKIVCLTTETVYKLSPQCNKTP